MPPRCDYLLRFQPLFRRYLWGGRRLASLLGKPLGDGDDYAESWEIVDHDADQSVLLAGPLAGKSLSELVRDHGEELLGERTRFDRFPLLFKFLDCNRTLSVQVHPNDEQAARLTPPDLGKTEAWVVLHADPGSRIFAGLREGVTREALAAATRVGRAEDCLHAFEPKIGDCVFIPARTVHALGAGLVVAEIQQSSDTTYRLFDWNRVDATGQPRALHIEQSLATIDYSAGPVDPQQPRPVAAGRQRLVECDKFVLDRLDVSDPMSLGGDGQFHLLAVLEGSLDVLNDPAKAPLAVGGAALLPAAADPIRITPQGRAIVLDIFLPA